MAGTFINVGATECVNCGQCCGGACSPNFQPCAPIKQCALYEICDEWVANFCGVALMPVGKISDPLNTNFGKYDIFDPDVLNGVTKALGLLVTEYQMDADGQVSNFRPAVSFVPQCKRCAQIYVSGVFDIKRIAAGYANQDRVIQALLALPNFAKELPNGDFKLL